MFFIDTETAGLTGPVILIQYAEDDGPVTLHEVFNESILRTLRLLERFCENDICGFNLTFDWFHITKLYNLLQTHKDKTNPPTIETMVESHNRRPINYCLRPKAALDLFLHSRKGPYQSLMDRRDITIRKIPYELADRLVIVLQQKLQLPWIYFARSREGYQWKVEPNKDNPQFSNVVLRFKASGSLKNLSQEIFKCKVSEMGIPKDKFPPNVPYNPYNTEWKDILNWHIKHWQRKGSKSYAEQDVILLQRLYHHFGEPKAGDYDSELAVCVGGSRWRGYEINLRAVNERINEQCQITASTSININSHIEVRKYLLEQATKEESICVSDTSAGTLRGLMAFSTKLGIAAGIIYNARRAKKELDILYKLRQTGRYCPEFKIIGTRSGRMAGGGGHGSINPQGINRDIAYRSIFTLAESNYKLSGGDFEGFEVSIADAVYNDNNLRDDLQSGKSFHGLFGEILYNLPYDQIMSSKGTDTDYYTPSKYSAFGVFYGAQSKKIATIAGISEGQAEYSYEQFIEKYPGIGTARKIIFNSFCSMRQPGGIGSPIIWKNPPDYISSFLGFRRYFSLENSIVKCLYKLGVNPPDNLSASGTCRRRDRDQTKRGALQSSLFACAFQLQAYNMRAAANHVIQSSGAQITKELQCLIWRHFQPIGVNEWKVQPFNVHDEVVCVHVPELTDQIAECVREFVNNYRSKIPLIAISWKTDLKDWSCIK